MPRYGDLLRDLRNPNLSNQRVEDIVRQFNEFGDREERYKAWTQPIDGRIDSRAIKFPFDRIYFNELETNVSSLRIPLPPEFTHLLVTGIGRTTATPATSQGQSLNFTFNGDTGANYQWSDVFGNNAGASGQSFNSQSNLPFGMFDTDNCPTDAASSFWTFISDYNRPSFWKMCLSLIAMQKTTASATDSESVLMTGFWKNKNAIQYMDVVPGGGLGGNLKAGSMIAVFGIL